MTGRNGDTPGDSRDQGWLVLTEGMPPYERFRYIARHILSSAVDEAARYAADERIFDDLDRGGETEEHLQRLDDALDDDGSLAALERAFLCEAVRAAMEDEAIEPSCLKDLVGIVAEVEGEEGAGPEACDGPAHG